MSDMSDDDATRMLAISRTFVRVVVVYVGERHDTRSNGQNYTAADRRPSR